MLTEGLATHNAFYNSVIAGLNCARGMVILPYVMQGLAMGQFPAQGVLRC